MRTRMPITIALVIAFTTSFFFGCAGDRPLTPSNSQQSTIPTTVARVFAPVQDGYSPGGDSTLPYAPNRVMVKFTEKALANSKLNIKMQKGASVDGALTDLESVDAIGRQFGVTKISRPYREPQDQARAKELGIDRWFRVDLGNKNSVDQAVAEYGADSNVEVAKPDWRAYPAAVPTDPLYADHWGHNNTAQLPDLDWGGTYAHTLSNTVGTPGFDANAEAAWDQGFGSASVIIAIIDSGVDQGHPDLNQVAGWDFGDNDSNPDDNSAQPGHGTAVAGVAAASVNNGLGAVGAAPGARIMALKVANSAGSMFFSAIESAIIYAADNGAAVINMSLGAAISSDPATDAAINYAFNAGVTILAATGNENASTISYPAIHQNVIGVGAASPCGGRKRSSSSSADTNPGVSTDPNGYTCDGERWWGSNYGTNSADARGAVDIIAPTILPTTDIQGGGGYEPGDYSGFFNGTSCATPYAAGVCALIKSKNPGWSPTQVRNQLVNTAQDIVNVESGNGWDRYSGYGMIDAAAAVGGGGGPVNQAPTANANGPYSGQAGTAVSFSSAGSSDADGTIVGYSWTFGDGGSSTASNPSYTYASAGTYTVSLTVTDDGGATGSNSTSATITAPPNNNPPVANFNGTPTSGSAPLTVSFSDQSTNSPTSWSWTFGDGGTSTAQNPGYTYTAAGTYSVSMTATNANGSNTLTRNAYITVNTPPPAGEGFILSRNADFSTDDRAFTTGETMYMKVWTNQVDFTNMRKERWELKEPNGQRVRQNFTNNGDGTWTASYALSNLPANSVDWTWKATVEDNARTKYQPSTAVTVTAGGGGGNQSPTANANGPYSGTVGNAVSFSSAGSSDPDGTIVGYSWDFGDGGTSTAQNPSYTYGATGNYTVTLTVTDDQGATGSNSTSASITGGTTNQSPTANANGPYSGIVGNAVSFSSAGSSDPDGTIVGYSWDFGDGGTSTAQNPSYTYGAAGNYTVTVTVTDDQGATGSNSTSASITAGGGGGGGDVVIITKAEWRSSKNKLKVEATSDDPNAVLTVVGWGTMSYDSKKGIWKFRQKNVSNPPATVTVSSDLGGSDTSNVKIK